MDDLLNEFLTETNESLDVVDLELVRFEKDPTDKAVLNNIFRLVHTVKGTCGFLGLPRLESVAHASENILGKFRDGELEVTTEAVSLILKSIDAIKSILADLEANECEPEGDDKELIDRLNEVASGKVSTPVAAPKPAAAKPAAPKPAEAKSNPKTEVDDSKSINVLGRELQPGEVTLDELEAAFRSAPGPEDMQDDSSEPSAAIADEDHADDDEPVAVTAAKTKSNVTGKKSDMDSAHKNSDTSVANQTVRVTVDLLEDMMTMVSELVLTRNQLMQIVREQDDSKFKVPLQRLNLVTTELQEGVMKTRMQPIGNAWQKLPRIVRDLSHELGKKIELRMIGAETELDRQVLELIKDPLTHMIRNSADHGLELPEKRLKDGKNELGYIKLNAYHEGGHVIIQISDDGAGLNIERIRQKAISSGLATEAELDEMTDLQIGNFIFKAGFSTAEKITSVSGRGVGMDVVRTNIEKIGGTVDVRSTPGKGSVFTVKIPLTLAIVSALIVEANGERFAIPQISVIELVRASNNSEHKIERIKDAPVLRLREQLLPLVYLRDVLRMGAKDAVNDSTGVNSNVRGNDDFVVVTQVGGFRFGIVVDRVYDTEEIVVKPVAPILRHISVFSGNTILGDGSVIMILDPNGIANLYGNVKVEQEEEKAEVSVTDPKDEIISMLIFKAGDATPKAVPLSLVARLEEIDSTTIEVSNGFDVVQYRGQLMPLVRVSDKYSLRTEGRQPMLVFADETRTMGLAVDEIVDIVESKLKIELTTETPGLVGTAVIAGAATEVIDVSHYLVVAFPDWFEESRKTRVKAARRILLIDDSPFFRNMLGPVLSAAGYRVTAVENAKEALKLRDEGAVFDAIVSDIEMPGISGFELASMIRADQRWGETPIVAISAHGTADDFERGREVGFSDYVVKMDRGALLRSLTETLSVYGEAV